MNEGFLFKSALLLEDDSAHAMLILRALKTLVETVHHVTTKKEALAFLAQPEQRATLSLVVSDLNVPDGKELEIVEPLIAAAPLIPVIVLTSSTSLATAISAMKVGARDYLVKNFGPDFKDTLSLALQRVALSMTYQRERQRLEKEMAILRLAVDNGTDGVALVSVDGTIEYCNIALSEIAHKLKGTTENITSLFSKSAQDETFLGTLHERIIDSDVWTTVFESNKECGVILRLELSRISGQSQSSPVLAMWLKDITDIKRKERFQRDILSTTTHDLKGPLGAILLSSEMISDKPDNTDRVKQLSVRISSAAQGAVNIIDEFLSARRIQEGSFILRPATYSLQEILDEIHHQFDPMMKTKQISFSIRNADDLHPIVDRLGLIRVIGNVLSNAVKFTPKLGSISLQAIAKKDDWQLIISDTGAGMEPQEARRLFERYARLERHTQIEGTGLGLFIVKSITEAHGGKISVTSSVGVGTSFEILLPMSPPVDQKGEIMIVDFAG